MGAPASGSAAHSSLQLQQVWKWKITSNLSCKNFELVTCLSSIIAGFTA